MKIFTDDFKNFLKRNFVCRFLGHVSSDWMDEWWAIAHSTGYQVKMCKRCNMHLAKRKGLSVVKQNSSTFYPIF